MFENLVSRSATKQAIPADFADGALTFVSTTGNAFGSAAASAAVLPKIQRPSNISIVGGEYSINGGAYTSAAGTIRPGNSVAVRVTAASAFNTDTVATLTVAGVPTTFTARSRWWPNATDIPNITTWYRPDGLPSGALETWNDNSGLAQNATRATATAPTVSTNVLNGYPTIGFNGAQAYATVAIADVHLLTGTVFAVFKNPTASLYATVMSHTFVSGGNTTRRAFLSPSWPTDTAYVDFGLITAGGRIAITPSPFDHATDYHVFTLRRNGGGAGAVAEVWRNGTSVASLTSLDSQASVGTRPFSIGADLGGDGSGAPSSYLTGNIAEIITVNASLTDANRQKVEGYLHWKYGLQANLPSGHPYKTVAP